MVSKSTTRQIKKKALALGFDACGIASSKIFEKESLALDSWIKNHYYAEMEFITRNREKRKDPTLLQEGTKSVVVVLLNYHNPDYLPKKQSDYLFAEYALGKDYHLVLKEKLTLLSDYIVSLFPESRTRCFVDSAPVFEKAFAVQAGLGWIGKNTLLIHPKGSTYFIGEVFTDLDLEPDVSYRKHDCGSCNKCVNACPTHALDIPYVLNANKCLSYQSIERKQVEWNASLKKEGTNYIYGCDICQRVCPYNSLTEATTVPEFAIKPEILSFSNTQWEHLSEEEFNLIFADSAVKRIGYLKLKENVRVANENGFSQGNGKNKKADL